MPRKPSTRVVLNRNALDKVDMAVADGVNEIARTIVETADPPDATPIGQGLVTNGGWITFVGSKKVDGGSLEGTQPRKPRALRLKQGLITAIAGFTFPGRFQEMGTVHHDAQPFLWPSAEQVAPHAEEIMRPAAKARLG